MATRLAGRTPESSEDAPAYRDLKALIRDRFVVREEVPYMTLQSYTRMSRMATVCPREEVLAARTQTVRTQEVSSDLGLIFAHGHGLHWSLQNKILAEVGVLRGQWRCLGCGRMYGVPDSPKPKDVMRYAVERPISCGTCSNTADASGVGFEYVEYLLTDHTMRVTAHPDGLLRLPGMPGMGVLEAKSISARGSWEVRNCPKMDHVVQIQGYMGLLGAKWGKILYWDKGGTGLGAFIEHPVEFDADCFRGIKKMLKDIDRSLEGGPVPARICDTADCKRAEECQMVEVCFKGGV